MQSVPRREQGSWSERWLRHRHARRLLVPLLIVAVVLMSSTTSLYLAVDPEGADAADIAVETPQSYRWSPMPGLSVSASKGRTLAGGPVFFELPPPLTLRVIDPEGSRVVERKSSVRPRPWRSVSLTTRDIEQQELRVVRLAPRSNLVSLLAAPGDASPNKVYSLSVAIDDQRPVEITDLRQGIVLLGAPEAVLRARLSRETIDERREALAGCVPVFMRTPQNVERMMTVWQPEMDNRRQFLATPVLGAAQSLRIEIFETGATRALMASRTVEAQELAPDRINTICLSRRPDAP
jgi:hypothetical protein